MAWSLMFLSFNSIQVYVEVNMYYVQLHNEDWNPKVYVPRNLYDRWYNELDEEKQLVGTAAHIL